MAPSPGHERVTAPAPAEPGRPAGRWVVGAYAVLALWGLGYLILFFAGVIGPR